MIFLWSFVLVSSLWAGGGFEKPINWTARGAQHGSAYGASVIGAEGIFFNAAGLLSDQKNELFLGVNLIQPFTRVPHAPGQASNTNFNGSALPVGLMYAHQLNSKWAIGGGINALGGLGVYYDDVDFSNQGPEFVHYRPDVFARLGIFEFGASVAYRVNSQLSVGGTLRHSMAKGDLSQAQVVEARNLGGLGIPDGTVMAINRGEFYDLQSSQFGAFLLGAKYVHETKKFGAAVTYRSPVTLDLKGGAAGEVVYSGAGAAAVGGQAGEPYSLKGGSASLGAILPEAWSFSTYWEIVKNHKLSFEYTWTEYSKNRKFDVDASVTNSLTGEVLDVPDSELKWHDLQDFKIGYTNTSFETWVLGGGYSYSPAVSNRKYAYSFIVPPAPLHQFYLGAGKVSSQFRIDVGYEYHTTKAKGKTPEITGANSKISSYGGDYDYWTHSFIFSSSYFF